MTASRTRQPFPRYVLDFPPPARHPLVVVLAAAAVFNGVRILIGGAAPGTTIALLSPVFVAIWAVGLLSSGVAFLLAAVWRDVVTGVLIEGAACVLGVFATATYTAAAITVLGVGSLVVPIVTTTAYGVGCLVRAVQIRATLKRAKGILQGRAHIAALPSPDGRA